MKKLSAALAIVTYPVLAGCGAPAEDTSEASLPSVGETAVFSVDQRCAAGSDRRVSFCITLSGKGNAQASLGLSSANVPNGRARVVVGTRESYGAQRGHACGTNACCEIPDNLNAYPTDTFPKKYYARFEYDDGSVTTLGPITISMRLTTAP